MDGQQLRVAVRAGDGTRDPLLVFNGIGASLDLLQPFVDALEPSLEAIRFEETGGRRLAAAGPCPYRFTGLCLLMARMLTTLGYGTVDVLGISWEGASRSTSRPSSGAAAAGGWSRASTATGATDGALPAGRARRDGHPCGATSTPPTCGASPRTCTAEARRTEPGRVSSLLHTGSRTASPRGYLYQLGAGAGWTSLPFLPLLRQATLIMSGDDDPLIPLANARLLRLLIPHARLHIYHGGHLGLVTEAAELAPAIEMVSSPRPTRPRPARRPAAGQRRRGRSRSPRPHPRRNS